MNIRAYITAYDRPEMLKQVIEHLNSFGIDPIVYEDGVTHPHRGKQGYWKTWKEILRDCTTVKADLYLFTPDDFQDLDIDRIKELHKLHKARPYVYNLVNDGRVKCWTGIEPKAINNETELIGFTDCGFFCNYEALKAIKFDFAEPSERWLKKDLSSGVGMNLTRAFNQAHVNVYRPYKSLAYHGEHESKMHPEERKNNPLISNLLCF